ncbi:protein of unassigned function [Methylobacterium oryzae CBMB20]|uniref:Protein of unassigned function n=1 Tax=Methylobacterium oryzae CBMB20 TaxID=693986 RepID=A0A089NYJ4_9HYPH|nr:protein of unassigned function [Methylobacterium oryzae CBMB20]
MGRILAIEYLKRIRIIEIGSKAKPNALAISGGKQIKV